MTWHCQDAWATTDEVGGNSVRQLLAPEANLELSPDTKSLSGPTGSWPAVRPGQSTPSGLYVSIPLAARVREQLHTARWAGDRVRTTPEVVLESYEDAVQLRQETDARPGLRRPQIGAAHAVLAYITTGRTQPCTVVMPTGTGKTDTMLTLLLAARPARLLVLVPSDALRHQVAGKFERLGVLHATQVAAHSALRPVVGRMTHGFTELLEAQRFQQACNVVVATTAVINSCAPELRQAFLAGFSHLFVDEAHHIAATTWRAIRDHFTGKPVVQFTATPYRNDGKHVGGDLIYAFPLKEAQRAGYFSKINFKSVVDLLDEDAALTRQAVEVLKADRASGLDHLMMVRASSKKRAGELVLAYQAAAPEFAPVLLHNTVPAAQQAAAHKALQERSSRIVVCVNMLGEGFDLPALKIAAIHDTQKSLGVTLQFIGRFTRTSDASNLGDATVLVARGDTARDPRLRALYAEDSDWNSVIRDLSDEAVEGQRAISAFESGFNSLPDEVTLTNLQPKMSTVVYRTPTAEWNPLAIEAFFGDEQLLTDPIGLNTEAGVAWCVVTHTNPVRWGDIRTLHDTIHELFIAYFDAGRRLLFINSSENDGTFQELADALAGPSVRYTGNTVYRVLGGLQRLIPTNVGLLDARSAFRRFSMLVGSDVHTGFSDAEASTKTQTHIAGSGFDRGEKVNISAALRGRIWSPATASTLKSWVDWCDGVGSKLLDTSITIDSVINSFLWPHALESRPVGVLISAEWPWTDLDTITEGTTIGPANGQHEPVRDVELGTRGYERSGPFAIRIECEHWQALYTAEIRDSRVVYAHAEGPMLTLSTRRRSQPLTEWLNRFGLTLLLDGDRIITSDGLLLDTSSASQPYNAEHLEALDWSGTDLRKESQGPGKDGDSIQARILRDMREQGYTLLIDDDGAGEAADIVALRQTETHLELNLVHCKYSSAPPGARITDLYEVCGQAQKSARWRDKDMQPLFDHLARRAKRRTARTGISPFEIGDLQGLHRLQDEARLLPKTVTITIVQPGLSRDSVSHPQLQVLGATELYVRQKADAKFRVICSD